MPDTPLHLDETTGLYECLAGHVAETRNQELGTEKQRTDRPDFGLNPREENTSQNVFKIPPSAVETSKGVEAFSSAEANEMKPADIRPARRGRRPKTQFEGQKKTVSEKSQDQDAKIGKTEAETENPVKNVSSGGTDDLLPRNDMDGVISLTNEDLQSLPNGDAEITVVVRETLVEVVRELADADDKTPREWLQERLDWWMENEFASTPGGPLAMGSTPR